MSSEQATSNTTAPLSNTEQTANSATMDPFAAQRDATNNPFSEEKGLDNVAGSNDMALGTSPEDKGRRTSKEWDASKVPPSQFQKRKGSILSTPSSRDSHTGGGSDRDKAYHEKLKEKGWHIPGKK